MTDFADAFGGKVDGELIRARNWNDLMGAINGLQGDLQDRLGAAEDRLNTAETALDTARGRIDDLDGLAALVRSRYRQLQLSTSRSQFAIGERAEIVAHVTDFDGAPLDLGNAATRPWVDFVTVWGSLKASPGFTSRAGTGGKTVTVQVNASGEARALLREETGQVLAEEQELEVAAVLDTTVNGVRVADAFMTASTPAASNIAGAYSVVSAAYERQDTLVIRNYLDGIYLNNPTRSYLPLSPAFTLNWNDEFATVMAFVKPDDSPGTSDSSMASGSIRVTFRDWVYPWIITQYLPPPPPLVGTYVTNFEPLIRLGLEFAVNGIFDIIQEEIVPLGLIGQQREYAAVQEAMRILPASGQPDYFNTMVINIAGGLSVQQGLLHSAALSAGQGGDATAPARAVAGAGVRGEVAALAVAGTIRAETATTVTGVETRIIDMVRAENTKFSNDLLADTGPIRRAENLAITAANKADLLSEELGSKANVELVGQLLAARGIG